MRRSFTSVFIAAALLPLAQVPNASAQILPESVRACAAEPDDMRRLACYDREIARLPAQAPGAQPATPAPAAAPTLSPEERFGLSAEQARRKQNLNGEPELNRITATVTAIATRPHGEVVMTLDNGHVWAQKSASWLFSVKVSDTVTIRTAALGSYLLSGPGGATKVTRIR